MNDCRVIKLYIFPCSSSVEDLMNGSFDGGGGGGSITCSGDSGDVRIVGVDMYDVVSEDEHDSKSRLPDIVECEDTNGECDDGSEECSVCA